MKRFLKQRFSASYIGFLAIAAACAAALTLGGGTARAAMACSVPTPAYPTIQAAVNNPNCNPINVAAGAYFENVTIPRSLTLNGAQAGNPVAGRISGGPLESTVNGANPIGSNPVITINAANVTIDGFTLKIRLQQALLLASTSKLLALAL
jgi:pectin methylesterase-like acyl-CoA thioesterase